MCPVPCGTPVAWGAYSKIPFESNCAGYPSCVRDVCWRRRKWHMRQTKIVVARYGGPEVITVAEEECPVPMPGEVRVKVLAAGVSLPDVLAREGVHPET